ncbi:MAG: AraC family transcriptional regulator [Mycolicibacterium sp.]|nr:AraC family transcriptional regulator [Mycolicibacterium sp.]
MTAARAIECQVTSGDLVTELAAHAKVEGANVGTWPGLTFYRFSRPTEPCWDNSRTVSIAIVAQTSDDTFSCVVIGAWPQGARQAFDASPERPCLCVRLEVDPRLVGQVAASMMLCDRTFEISDHSDDCVVSGVDGVLMSSVVRFLHSLSVASDRQVLAPLYLQELVYRVLQRDQTARLLRIAARQSTLNSVAAATDYIAVHLAEPLTVTELAKQVSLSPSAFSRLFREVTGRSPYQFVKEERLIRARDLLGQGQLGVTDAARSVGYPSLSHFIKEFRVRFGCTPGEYVLVHNLDGRLRALRTRTS